MKRFKVGDKVRAVKQVLFTPAAGTEGVVIEVYTDRHYDYAVDFSPEFGARSMNDDELELVTQTIEVGDKVRATSEFTVEQVFPSGVLRGTDGRYRYPSKYEFEVIEKAVKITFTVGQVLTTEDELKALPEGTSIARVFSDGSGRLWQKSNGEFRGQYGSYSVGEMLDSPTTITVVWLP